MSVIIYTNEGIATYEKTVFNYYSNHSMIKAVIIWLVPFDLAERLRPQFPDPFPVNFAHGK